MSACTHVCVCCMWKVEAKDGDGTENQTDNAGTHTHPYYSHSLSSKYLSHPSSEAALSLTPEIYFPHMCNNEATLLDLWTPCNPTIPHE